MADYSRRVVFSFALDDFKEPRHANMLLADNERPVDENRLLYDELAHATRPRLIRRVAGRTWRLLPARGRCQIRRSISRA